MELTINKPLDDRLFDFLNGYDYSEDAFITAATGGILKERSREAFRIAAEIIYGELNSDYLPRPRFKDGQVLKVGQRFDYDGETYSCDEYTVESSGTFHLRTNEKRAHCSWTYSKGAPVRRPSEDLLGYDGLPIALGQAVYTSERPTEMCTVVGFEGDNVVLTRRSIDERELYHHSVLSHAPKVCDKDGVPINVGDIVYTKNSKYKVDCIDAVGGVCCVHANGEEGGPWGFMPDMLRHVPSAYSADGLRIKIGDTVYFGTNQCEVESIDIDDEDVRIIASGCGVKFHGSGEAFTFARPDSIKRIKEDAIKPYAVYLNCDKLHAFSCDDECPSRIEGRTPAAYYKVADYCEAMSLDIVARCEKVMGNEGANNES